MFKEIPTNGEINEKKKTLADFEKYRIRHTDEVIKPDVVFFVNGQMVCSRKNIFGITGKAKAGKSYAMSLIIAAVLQKGEFQGVISSFLPKGKDKIILFDTEQSEYHISVILDRIKKLGTTDKQMENLIVYSFDTLRSSKRREFFEDIIFQTEETGLILIDGVADLMASINDETSAADMLDDLRSFATKLDVAIGYVLHQNPSDNLKMRGHVGTIATNKSETVFQVASVKDNKTTKLVEFLSCRNKHPENFSFEILEDGIPEIQSECYEEPKAGRKVQKQLKDFEKYAILNEIFTGMYLSIGIGYTVLTEKIKEIHLEKHGTIGVNALKELVTYCREMNWIVQDKPKSNYFIHPFK